MRDARPCEYNIRVRRRLFGVAAALSLVLCVGAVLLWSRSYQHILTLSFERTPGRWYCATSSNGHITWEFRFCADPFPADRTAAGLRFNREDLGPDSAFVDDWPRGYGPYFVGFGIGSWATGGGPTDEPNETYHCRGIRTPDWAIVLLCAVLPITWMATRRRASRCSTAQRCLSCGYNLTGNTSGICPECGRPVPKKTEAPA